MIKYLLSKTCTLAETLLSTKIQNVNVLKYYDSKTYFNVELWMWAENVKVNPVCPSLLCSI